MIRRVLKRQAAQADFLFSRAATSGAGKPIDRAGGARRFFVKLRIGLPKGSLQDATFALFKKAGWDFKTGARSYQPTIDDPELEPVLLRAQEIPRYVDAGVTDMPGFMGLHAVFAAALVEMAGT